MRSLTTFDNSPTGRESKTHVYLHTDIRNIHFILCITRLIHPVSSLAVWKSIREVLSCHSTFLPPLEVNRTPRSISWWYSWVNGKSALWPLFLTNNHNRDTTGQSRGRRKGNQITKRKTCRVTMKGAVKRMTLKRKTAGRNKKIRKERDTGWKKWWRGWRRTRQTSSGRRACLSFGELVKWDFRICSVHILLILFITTKKHDITYILWHSCASNILTASWGFRGKWGPSFPDGSFQLQTWWGLDVMQTPFSKRL